MLQADDHNSLKIQLNGVHRIVVVGIIKAGGSNNVVGIIKAGGSNDVVGIIKAGGSHGTGRDGATWSAPTSCVNTLQTTPC
jgi:hypothetical protein